MKCKQDEQRSEKQDKDFIERLEQIQLAESFVNNSFIFSFQLKLNF
jgi:hypothetical protein